MFEEHALDAERHDRAGFSCAIPELDDYLHRLATQHRRKGVSTVHVLIDSAAPGLILGYCTLSAAQVDVTELTDADRKRVLACLANLRLICDSTFLFDKTTHHSPKLDRAH